MPDEHHPDHAPLELEHFLPYRLSILSNAVSQAIADDYQRRFDLSMTEWRVMAVLARFDGLSAREVAERTLMDKVAVSRALSQAGGDRLGDPRHPRRRQAPLRAGLERGRLGHP